MQAAGSDHLRRDNNTPLDIACVLSLLKTPKVLNRRYLSRLGLRQFALSRLHVRLTQRRAKSLRAPLHRPALFHHASHMPG